MKPLFVTLTLIIAAFAAKAQKTDTTRSLGTDTLIYTSVGHMPQFPEGITGFFKYLKDSLRYPVSARRNGIEGRVIVTFVIEMDGSLDNVRILKSLSPETDEEAGRLIKECPKWLPGYQNGKPARVVCPMPVPVVFKLPN